MADFCVANISDLNALTAFVRDYYADDGYPFDEPAVRSALTQLIERTDLGRVWIVRADDEAVGYLAVTLGFSIEYKGRDAFIDEVYFVPAWRGKGLGAKAMAVAEQYCLENGVQAIHLEVERDKSNAIALYNRNGFQETGRLLLSKRLTDTSRSMREC